MFTPMSRRSAVALSLALFAAAGRAEDKPADAPVDLKVGDKAPAFELRTDADTTWTSADHVGKKWVVVYFYPGDFTPGCTAQANAFKDGMNQLAGLGVEVVGVSGDSVRTHGLFKEAQSSTSRSWPTRRARRRSCSACRSARARR